ncbi:MAG: SHOCT domain-containing protein [Candidatus Brocadiia bacterium]
MNARFLGITAFPLALLVTACSTGPVLDGSDGESRGSTEDTVELASEGPGSGFERTGTKTGFADGNCQGPRADAAREAALTSLRERASASGADYVKVVGSGPMEERGMCANDVFRVSGVTYKRAESGEEASEAEADAGAASADEPTAPEGTSESTADKLEELENLREEGLITDDEYERLREQVLDEAF